MFNYIVKIKKNLYLTKKACLEFFKLYWKKLILYLIVFIFFAWITLFSDNFGKINSTIQVFLYVTFSLLHFLGGPIISEIESKKIIHKLKAEKIIFDGIINLKESKITSLEKLITRFINHSSIYRKNIIDALDVDEEYLCIDKSSEGFQNIYDDMEKNKCYHLPRFYQNYQMQLDHLKDKVFSFSLLIKNQD